MSDNKDKQEETNLVPSFEEAFDESLDAAQQAASDAAQSSSHAAFPYLSISPPHQTHPWAMPPWRYPAIPKRPFQPHRYVPPNGYPYVPPNAYPYGYPYGYPYVPAIPKRPYVPPNPYPYTPPKGYPDMPPNDDSPYVPPNQYPYVSPNNYPAIPFQPEEQQFNTPPYQPPAATRVHKDGDKLSVRIDHDRLHIGPVSLAFHRTLRIPDDGEQYPLPPSLGNFPLRRVADYADRVPASWREHGGVFLPMLQREAMWMQFSGQQHRPNALKVAIGKVNALSGEEWSERLVAGERGASEQDYLVVPDQPWIDGINAGDGFIKQFVAMPLGMGYTVEGQITGKEEHGGIQLCVYEPKPGKFPDAPPPRKNWHGRGFFGTTYSLASAPVPPPMAMLASSVEVDADEDGSSFAGAEMGLGGGGEMRQSIYPDAHGLQTWDQENYARVFVHIVSSEMWTEITGEALPASPVSAKTYAENGMPWYDLYDEDRGDIEASEKLAGVKSVKEIDKKHGFAPQQDDTSVDISEAPVHKYTPPPTTEADPNKVSDGKW